MQKVVNECLVALPKAKDNFLHDFVGLSPKSSTVDFLPHFFYSWVSRVWLLLLYNWQLDSTNKYPEHRRPEFDVSLCLWIFKHVSPIFLKIVPVRPLDSNILWRHYIVWVHILVKTRKQCRKKGHRSGQCTSHRTRTVG